MVSIILDMVIVLVLFRVMLHMTSPWARATLCSASIPYDNLRTYQSTRYVHMV